jgi:two-component system, NtrC family, nitrogen regulation sensor histidine kinase GlnL
LAPFLLSVVKRCNFAALHEETMQLDQDILDTISTGILALDEELKVQAINNAAQSVLAVSAARTIGKDGRKLVINGDEVWDKNLEQALSTRTPIARRGIPIYLLNGQEIHVDLMITPVTQGGKNAGLLIELQPVDRLLRISREEGLLHSQQTSRAMIRGLAHEIKNPLGGVRGAAQLLARQLPDEELREYTNVIISEADRLRDLVDRMLGPNQELNLQPTNIHEVLEHVRNLVEAETEGQISIARDYDPSLPEIPGDRIQLTQAVLNIVRNALQATESAETCQIGLRTRPRRQFTIGDKRHRLVIQIDIFDNGPGIPQDLQHAIFMPLVTGRADGTGLGLSIAQGIINRHGGLLECKSEPGNTKFTIFIPMEVTHNA